MYDPHLVFHKSIAPLLMNDEITKLFVVLARHSPHNLLGLNLIVFLPLPEVSTITGSSCMLWFISTPFFTHWSQWMVFWFPWRWLFFPLIKWNLLVPFSPSWPKGYTVMNQGQCIWGRQRQRVAGRLLGWNGAGMYLLHWPWIIIKRNIKRSLWHQGGHRWLL